MGGSVVAAGTGAQPEGLSLPLPPVQDAARTSPRDARELSRVLFDRLRVLDEGTAEYQYTRNTLIELNLSLVRYAAARFKSRSEPYEDVLQVGTIGLIKAIDRFEVSREVEFATFAVPYITGEIKRFFRDTSWAVHVPRRLQELRLDLAKAAETLAARLDREPGTQDLADFLGISPEEVTEGLMASRGYVADSLDAPVDEGDGAEGSLADRLGSTDPALEAVENLQALAPILADLGERDRRILQLRFGGELTQSEIGAELGISQMHVSRLLSRTLARLRRRLLQE